MVFSEARLSLSDFVVARSCATVSFSALDLVGDVLLGDGATGAGVGADHRAELRDAERAADRTEACRDRDAGGEQRKARATRGCGAVVSVQG